MAYSVTRENLLDLLVSHGREMKMMCNPSSHPYDDPRRAAPYKAKVAAAREAWKRLKGGADELEVVQWLHKQTIGEGIHLWEAALLGEFETEQFSNLKGFNWITYQGDFYGVSAGDDLNLPHVRRIANKYLSEEERKLEGAQAIAAQMPNPCTRIIRPIHVS